MSVLPTVSSPASEHRPPPLTMGAGAGWLILAIVFTAPIGLSSSRPIGPYHVLAPLIFLLVATVEPSFFRRYYALLTSAVLGIFVIALADANGVTIDPALSAYHFLAPYLGVGLGIVVIKRVGNRAWEYMALLSVIPGLVTLVAAGGRMTRTIPVRNGLGLASRVYSVGTELPFLAGRAQVNSWGSYLVGWMLISIVALLKCPTLKFRHRACALGGIAFSMICIAQSGSRANTLVAVLAVGLLAWKSGRGQVRINSRHRKLVMLGVAVAAIAVIWVGSSTAANNTRIISTIEAIFEGEAGTEFAGRQQRVDAMTEDIFRQPVFATGFHDFELRHPELERSSPHNQWIGTVHKLGFLGAAAYVWLLFPTLRMSFRDPIGKFMIFVILLLGFTYDVFTAPPGGALLLFLLGAHAATVANERQAAADLGTEGRLRPAT